MLPRPQGPFPGRVPPRMMHSGMSRGNFPPMSRMGMGQGMQRGMQQRSGGLLAKLLGKGGTQGGAVNPFGPANASRAFTGGTGSGGGGGILKALSNPQNISGFLSNTQKVLNTAQQIGPMVQQYGPLVRNLPAMWKLYKGFKDLPSDSQEEEKPTESSSLEAASEAFPKKQTHRKRKQKASTPKKEEEIPAMKKQSTKGTSTPKLYI
ncbi:VrrA/YqfQ family protein [Bacillus dakarensis]|uniref:VrrA/YqfQ family protein n=1 Tax=Robertmurraya dakarensis TaxID=1926278 RepID=UPI0009813F75|nr:VrrA/YqfQ family protein [Bacillus dakarensis]